MKIAFVSEFNIKDPGVRSGVPFFMAKGFEDLGHEVIQIGPFLKKRSLYHRARSFLFNTYYNKVLKGKRGQYINIWSEEFLRNYARQAEEKLKFIDYDILLSPEAHTISYLNVKKPIIFWRDATFDNLLNYYDSFKNLNSITISQGHASEMRALQNAFLAVYTSKWAQKSAIIKYQTEPLKTIMVERGANLMKEPTLKDIRAFIEKKINDTRLELLYISADWQRKGGKETFLVAKHLKKIGIDVRLHVVGVTPPQNYLVEEWIEYHGFLKKSTKEGADRLSNLYLNSHFFIMPSLAENFGIVYAEASAYGVPSIGMDTGGVAAAIKHLENGLLLPVQYKPLEIAETLLSIWLDKKEYNRLCYSSRTTFELKLNWKSNCKRVIDKYYEISTACKT